MDGGIKYLFVGMHHKFCTEAQSPHTTLFCFDGVILEWQDDKVSVIITPLMFQDHTLTCN